MKLDGNNSVGLSSAEALKKLHDEIEKELEKYENKSENLVIYKNANENQILPIYSLVSKELKFPLCHFSNRCHHRLFQPLSSLDFFTLRSTSQQFLCC